MTEAAAIDVKGLTRRYGAHVALDDVTLEVPKGALCGLVGPNGAGKTTLFAILAALDEELEGEALVAGRSVREDPMGVRARVGFVPDHAAVYDGLSVEEYLGFFAGAYELPKPQRARAVEKALALSGLDVVRARPAGGLSKGMTQRLCVARALLHDPEVLLLDEPASGLDPRARIELKQLLKALVREGRTVLVSSHILTELGDLCDSLIVLERGRVVVQGEMASLWEGLAREGGAPRRVLLEVDRDGARAESALRELACVHDVLRDDCLLTVLLQGERRDVARLVRALVDEGLGVLRVAPERRDLEALFLTVTKGELQ